MSAKPLLTGEVAFFQCSTHSKLLAVRGGVPIDDALELASSFLASAQSLAYSVAGRVDDDHAFAVAYLIDMGKAIIESALIGLARDGGDV